MQRRYTELPLADEVELTKEQLHVLDGVARAARDPRVVLDLILDSDDVEVAATALSERLSFTEIQTRAVLDMQFRLATRLDRSKIEERRDEVAEHLRYLRGLHRSTPESE